MTSTQVPLYVKRGPPSLGRVQSLHTIEGNVEAVRLRSELDVTQAQLDTANKARAPCSTVYTALPLALHSFTGGLQPDCLKCGMCCLTPFQWHWRLHPHGVSCCE